MKLCPDEEELEAINLTPMIDVVFLLLIFFLTATTFHKEEVEMSLDLPEAASGKPASAEKKVIIINVASDGRVLVNGREVTVMALRQKLKAAATRDKDQEVLIRGDEKTQFGLVAQVFDACLLAKLHSISIGADPVGDEPR